MMLPFLTALDRFFHARVGEKACSLCGYIRIFYAFLILCDKALWTVDFEFFFLSGRLPFEATSKDPSLAHTFTIFSLAPEWDFLYLFLHVLSCVSAVLLLLGIMPRFQLILGHVLCLCFQHHNAIIWDGEDAMFRVWNVLMMFLPLHHVTIYDLLLTPRDLRRTKQKTESSWPMWPFRLWQLEVCFIYLGAAMGKLSSDRWINGVALYHVIHITDFFGGAFAPDIVFNRFGPLKLMTYASLVVESTCIFFIWPKATRMLTFYVVIALHLGIELAMNMHCFEWLTMMGWVFFLVEPQHNEPVALEDDGRQSKKQSTARHGLTAILLAVLTVFALDTAPIDEAYDVFPIAFHPPLQIMGKVQNSVRRHVVTPYLTHVGLAQGVWNMFMAAPDQVFTYEAIIKFHNDSVTVWNQPHWEDKNWLEKKRWQRPMTFYDALADGYIWPVMEAFTRGIANDHGGTDIVRSVLLNVHTDRPPPPHGLTFFDRARQKRFRESSKRIFQLNLCDDFTPKCAQWAAAGDCLNPAHWKPMLDECRRSCGFCYDTSVIRQGSRIALLWPDDMEYYAVTVVNVTHEGRRFRLEYDDYEFEDEQFEWLDRVEMRQRRFKLLAQSEDPDMTEPTPLAQHTPASLPTGQGVLHRPVQLTANVKATPGFADRMIPLLERDEQFDRKTDNPKYDTTTLTPKDGAMTERAEQPKKGGAVAGPNTPVESDTAKEATRYQTHQKADTEHNHMDGHVKLTAHVEVNPGMVWLNNKPTKPSAPKTADDISGEESANVKSSGVSTKDATGEPSVGSETTEGNDSSHHRGNHAEEVPKSAYVEISPGMVWIGNSTQPTRLKNGIGRFDEKIIANDNSSFVNDGSRDDESSRGSGNVPDSGSSASEATDQYQDMVEDNDESDESSREMTGGKDPTKGVGVASGATESSSDERIKHDETSSDNIVESVPRSAGDEL